MTKVKRIKFEDLWKNHPTVAGNDNPCTTGEKVHFANQCAIRVGVSLASCGVDTSKIPGAIHCWHHEKSEGHILAAEKLAKGLNKTTILGVGKYVNVEPKDFEDTLDGQTGIIFFKDYWQRKGETIENQSGDHIDLWNGSRITSFTSWFRIQLGISIQGYWSDFEKSKAIWFWPVK